MNINWQIAQQEFELHRYPKGQHDKSLQAWDSADELVINHLTEQTSKLNSITVMNDSFGAISLACHTLFPNSSIYHINDSYISERALEQNLNINNLDASFANNGKLLNSLSDLPSCDLVIIKLTKNLGYLQFQLEQISKFKQPISVIATGKTTQVTNSVLKLFDRYFQSVSTSLAKKKSRLILAKFDPKHSNQEPSPFPVAVDWTDKGILLKAHANVFSKDQIDIGGRFLADNLPSFQLGQKIIDLGCGNGLLGMCALKTSQETNTPINMTFVDESFMAVKSAELNVTEQFPELLAQCSFLQDDCLSLQANNSADVILCNPPFHQQNAITEHIAKQMFKDSFRVLKNNGVLYVVANRHLPYPTQLKKHFGGFKIHTQNKKFVIYQCMVKKLT